MNNTVIIVGAGVAGIEAANTLANYGVSIKIFEQQKSIGGNLLNTSKLFPNFQDVEIIKQNLAEKVNHPNIKLYTDIVIEDAYNKNDKWFVKDADNREYDADALLISSGFKVFDAKYKEELGYGIYEGVINTVEFEQMYMNGKITDANGNVPERIAFLNCVGSRDEKVGNHYCSRVCCINAVKQSIEAKELLPETEVFCFYMDIRMAGQFYEELYRKSQEEYNVNYIRGRISEAAQTIDNKIQIKAEDTLSKMPMKMTVDLLVLMTGVEASDGTIQLGEKLGLKAEYGFAKSKNLHFADNITEHKGLFLAGTCKRPLTLPETTADARAAAGEIIQYINKLKS